MFKMFQKTFRHILPALPVFALCGLLTLPVLAATPGGSPAPAFLAQLWSSLTELISGPAPPDDTGVSELRHVTGEAGSRFDPVGQSEELSEPTSTDSDPLTVSSPVAPEEDLDDTSTP